ncbi:MAG: FKBP-type peptidyl-prolyl cis-trans isomerase [Verrucomicrobiales bacterium]|nr:FKBP-type peptidyl-prolyl cis-trans isomerase [Verrucomicrobiales bacterium]
MSKKSSAWLCAALTAGGVSFGFGQKVPEASPAAPAPPPAASAVPAPPPVPVPPATPPATPAVPAPGSTVAEQENAADAAAFKTPVERRSYAIGVFFANQIKRSEEMSGKISLAEVEAGLQAVLSGEKSTDYARGANLGSLLKQDEINVDKEVMLEALRTAMAGGKARLSENGQRNEMQLLQQEGMQRRQEKARIEGEKNLAAANEFLQRNKTAEGVKTTASGLQYKIEQDGSGKNPTPQDLVIVNLRTLTIDGQEIEKTPANTPRTISQRMNKGLEELFPLIKVGSKVRAWVPPALAYGPTPRPGFKPNALVVYEIELLATKLAPATSGASVATPSVGVPGTPAAKREPITATTPPISVEIPPKGAPKKEVPKVPETPKPQGEKN